MKKIFTLFLLLLIIMFSLLIANPSYSQNKQKNKPDKRFFLGGNLGLQFGTLTLINVSPLVGYRFTDNIAAGIGGTYQYFKDKHISSFPIETDIYGGRIFARYYFKGDNYLDNLFIHTEYEYLSLEAIIINPYNYYEKERVYVPLYFIGGGIQFPISSNSYFTVVVLWDLIEDVYSPYVNPVIRVGVDFGV